MLISLVVALVILGVLLYLLTLLPMDHTIRQIVQVLVILAVVLWLLSLFGLIPGRLASVLSWWKTGARA